MKLLPKREQELGRLLYPEADDIEHPVDRGECKDGHRPCPLVGCQYHLYLDVNKTTGAIKLNFPDLEVEEMTETCALDVADRGGTTLEEVGVILNVTRERVRQIEEKSFSKISDHPQGEKLKDYIESTSPRVRLRVIQPVEEEESEEDEG